MQSEQRTDREQCRAPAQLLHLHPTTTQPYNSFVDIMSLLCTLSPLFLLPLLLIITAQHNHHLSSSAVVLSHAHTSLPLCLTTPLSTSFLSHTHTSLPLSLTASLSTSFLSHAHTSLPISLATPLSTSSAFVLYALTPLSTSLTFVLTLSHLCPLHSHPFVLATAAFLTITTHHHCHLFPPGLCSSSILSRSSTLCSHHCFVAHHLSHHRLYSIPTLSNPMLLFPIIIVCVSAHASFDFVVANT